MSIKTINAILIDDEPENNDVLELILDRVCPQVNIMAKCNTAISAIAEINRCEPDLIFLDIEMPIADGFEVLNGIEKPNFKVIIVTGHEQYALKAIKYAAIDYVMKPVAMDELKLAVQKVENTLLLSDKRLELFSELLAQQTIEKIMIPSANGFRTISLSNIMSIKAESGNYCQFKLADNNSFLASKPLSHFEEILPKTHFFRIHRSHMINLNKVLSLDRSIGKITLDNGEALEIAFRRRADFFNQYKKFINKTI